LGWHELKLKRTVHHSGKYRWRERGQRKPKNIKILKKKKKKKKRYGANYPATPFIGGQFTNSPSSS
jgi:hypothetical protein